MAATGEFGAIGRLQSRAVSEDRDTTSPDTCRCGHTDVGPDGTR